jgi:hypothetical protein
LLIKIYNMDYFRIYKLTEKDFDGIIKASGGKRLHNNESGQENLNADYLFDDAIIELKFVEEEGLEKQERQQKIATLFNKCFPHKPVVVLDPKLLGETERREYYKIMYTPIKTCIKKADKQLTKTAEKYKDKTKVVVLLNVGYGSLRIEEFKDIAVHRVHNDTTQIDCLIVGGIYFYSDNLECYAICPFEKIPINLDKSFNGFDNLKQHWGAFLNDFMKPVVFGNREPPPERLPVIEIDFEVDGVKYVKPPPNMGPSKLWPKGRPRENSTGITQCPPFAITFPNINKENWFKFKAMMPEELSFQETYSDWLRFTNNESETNNKVLQPFVPVEVEHEDFRKNCKVNKASPTFRKLCLYVNEVFDRKAKNLINLAIDKAKSNLILPSYIFLQVEEIGQDKASDLCSIYDIRQTLGQQNTIKILKNEKLFFEYGLALAASYAVKNNISFIVYERIQKYMWK